ncbi:MAG: TonB-dependent receptor, partial [Thermoflexibacteraceae bacterium]
YEYNFVDSADYVTISNLLEAANTLNSSRLMGYVQQNHSLNRHTITYGLRANYWDLNGQFLLSPRLQYAYKPNWKKDIVFNLAVGYYQQPPFYRELRNYQGQLNLNLKAQTSVHLIGGMNYDFKYWDRPFRLIAEAYYKYLTNVVPYDVDNVRLRYYAQNNAVAFTTGIDARLSGEFIKGTDSWIGVSVMTAQEKVDGDERGFIRRPVDQRFTLTMNFEDHLPKQPTWRMNFRMMYGSGLPFGVPNDPTQRAVLSGNNYWRVDIGFSKIIYLQNRKDRSLWLGLEILNLLGNNNTISYLWIKDYGNRSYAIPNGLSQRFINLRAIFRWN